MITNKSGKIDAPPSASPRHHAAAECSFPEKCIKVYLWFWRNTSGRTSESDWKCSQQNRGIIEVVMPGLDPGIHVLIAGDSKKDVDGRVKPGHDEN
jgi:hypothetical protein